MSATFPRGIEIATGVVIENNENKVLLTKSPKWNNKWVLPGGHIEPGETILEAGVREGEEETGLKLDGIAIFTHGELIASKDFHRPAHFIYFNAYCKVASGEVQLDQTELTEYQWLTPEQALFLDLGESYKETLEAFILYKGTK